MRYLLISAILLLFPAIAFAGDCCQESSSPGCDDYSIQICVCAVDPYCCDTAWDSFCVDEVEDYGCGSCSGGDYCPGYAGSSACCTTDNSCNWANDGYCDCQGTCSWDIADCGGGVDYCPGYTGSSSCCTNDNSCDWDNDNICDCQGTCSWDSADCNGPTCGDGSCDAGETCTNCEQDCGPCGGSGDCCEVQDGPGCGDAAIQACVCAQDSYCCDNTWDQWCVDEVEDFGCGSCGGGGDDYCPGYTGTSYCCAPDNPCNWANDNICDCQGTCSWDSADCSGPTCGDGNCDAGETCTTCEQDCGPCGGSGDCCEVQDGPGCNDPAVQACVCAQDAYCCENSWDSICVDEVEGFGCGDCGGGGDDYCPGYTGSSGCCTTDDPCNWASDNICDCDGTCTWDAADCSGPICGDGICNGDETCTTCEQDCGPCGGSGDCCEIQDGPGCGDPAIQACVCAQDSYCCETAWDQLCVDEVEQFGCGDCGGGGDDYCPGYTGGSSCCAPDNPCNWDDDNICDCQGTCSWDSADCGGGPSCGDGSCDVDETCVTCEQDCGPCGGSGDCCEIQDGPGCGDPAIQACVCAQDSFCCENTWDSICVDEVEEFGCGNCGGGPACGDGVCEGTEDCVNCEADCGPCGGSGDCCKVQVGPGCGDPAIQACVCAQDPFCCDTTWDQWCVDEVEEFGCGVCEGGGPACGDGVCDQGEDCANCEPDCGPCGGGGDCCEVQDGPGCDDALIQGCVCQQDAFCCNVAWDQICVDEVEELGCGVCGGCVPDCAGKQCGGDGCGGTCGECPAIQSCQNGQCVGGCEPNCTGLECGPDGCGGSCGDCTPGKMCQQGHCVPVCQPDCAGMQCGDDGCGGTCGSCPPGYFCQDGHCGQDCIPSCIEKECGDDGCGGTCGSCPPGWFCNFGKCSADCEPNCAGKQCGDDGCGGTCGSCPAGYSCDPHGHCVDGCSPSCAGKECGDNGCGGSCGSCGFGYVCNDAGVCVEPCQIDCLNKECGDDGCGGSCGVCGSDQSCSDGICVACAPDCLDKECGPDGCGGICGECPEGTWCSNKGWCLLDGEDSWSDDVAEVDGFEPGGGNPCGENERLLYGKCVPAEPPGDVESKAASGCTAGASPAAGGSLFITLLALVGLAALRRRQTS